jgi:hypothetical protein
MKLSNNVVFQGLAMIVQYGNQASGFVPPKAQVWVGLAVGVAQAAVAWRAQFFNPDGTPATTAYVKK